MIRGFLKIWTGFFCTVGILRLNGKMLEQNQCIKTEIRDAVNGGMPCMAECGGFMYLHEEMEDMEGRFCKMAGVNHPGKVFRTPGLSRFGYIMLSQQKTVLGEKDLGRIPAHEFHYFDSETCGKDSAQKSRKAPEDGTVFMEQTP